MRRSAILLALAGILLAPPSLAVRVQSPDAPWRTIETAHYRIHYPARGGFEAFAKDVASRIEGIHAEVTRVVGYEAKGTVDVVVRDPAGEANGRAVPLLGHPLVELWPTPPGSDSSIGHFTSWPELVVTHELTHVHHLARPQEGETLVEKLLDLPVGPVAVKAPRWVTEGYATLVEGRLTGSGRPFSAYRAAALRALAIEGKLPAYGDLSRTSGFRGGERSYLAGSAYLEWLERRAGGRAVLAELWQRLASPRRRGFTQSFEATFGISPRDGWDRFRAEVTRDALEWERLAKEAGVVEGEPWARLDGEASDLSVSPDGARLLVRVLSKRDPGLRVYALGAPAGARPKDGRKRDAGEATEPPDARPEFPAREAERVLPRIDGSLPERPSWAGREAVLLLLKRPDGEGVLVRRPYLWTLGGRLDAAPGGTESDDDAFRPAKREEGWVATRGSASVVLPFEPAGPLRLDAARGLLYGAAVVDGVWNVVRLPVRDGAGGPVSAGPVEVLTRVTTAAWNPAPAPDGTALFFTRLSARGVEVRRLELASPRPPAGPLPSPAELLAPASVLAPLPGRDALPPPAEPPASRPYDALEAARVSSRSGFSVTPSGTSWQVGAGGADVLGRLSLLALAGFGDGAGPRGAVLGIGWRGARPSPVLTLFTALERPSSQRFVPVEGLDRQRTGGELAGELEGRGPTRWSLRPALAAERLAYQGPAAGAATRALAGLDAAVSRSWSRGEAWGLGAGASATLQAGRTAGDGWSLLRGRLAFRARTPLLPLSAAVEAGTVSGAPSPVDLFALGGVTTSLVPVSLDAARVAQAALPTALATGDRMLRTRVEAGRGLRLYLEHAAAWSSAGARPAFARVVGLEASLASALLDPLAVPLVGRLELTAGVHRVLDGAMEGRTVGTVLLVTRP